MKKTLLHVAKYNHILPNHTTTPKQIGIFKKLRKKMVNFMQKQWLHTAASFNTGNLPQSAITCSKLTIETLEQGVKYVQSKQ